MQVWRDASDVPSDLGRPVVTVGNFDGVHRGHQHVLARAQDLAARLGGAKVVAITFDPHPMAVLRPEHAPTTLTDFAHRGELLAAAGADAVYVLTFDREMASWTPREFIDRVLVDTLGAAGVVVGANFRFGAKAAGDVDSLREAGATSDFVVEPIALDGGPQVWSSTYVRTCLAAGDVEGAAEALGRDFAVRGVVSRGDRRGRELGFPTANIPVRRGLAAPADGVYAGWLERRDTGQQWPAAISVGTNPTFEGERDRRVEAYALDAVPDTDALQLYDVSAEVRFHTRVRGMERFVDVDALVAAMHSDVRQVRAALGLADDA